MMQLALAGLRYRVAAFVATFLAVLLGCAMLIACGGLFESGLRLGAEPQRLAGAPIVVTGPSGFKLPDEESETVAYAERSSIDPALVDKIKAVPGVADAIPDVSFPAVLGNSTDVLAGHDWKSAPLTPYTLVSGTAPGPGQVVVSSPGPAQVTIAVNGAPETFTVSGVARSDHHSGALFFATADVRRFAPRVDAIGVLPASGSSVDDLAARLSFLDLPVLTGSDRGAAEFPGITASMLPLILLSSIFGGMVIVVMGLVVWATISLSVRQRQHELALLRATGATPAQVSSLVMAETMAVSVLAVLGGLALGGVMGNWIFGLSSTAGVFPPALEFRQGPIPFAAGVLLALVVPWVAARFAGRAAGRTRPIEALAAAEIPPVVVNPARRLLALVFAGGTAILALTTMFLDPDTASAIGGPAVLTGAITVALIGPEIIGRVLRQRDSLAVINTRSRAVQFAAVLTPLTLATAIALGNIYAQTTQDQAATDSYVSQFTTDAVITSTTGGISPSLVSAVRSTPGVSAVSTMVTSRGWIEEPYDGSGSDPWPFLGIDGPALASPVTAGSLADLAGDSVALPSSQAESLDLTVGSPVTLRLGDGTQAKVKVVALLDGPSIVVATHLLAPHTTNGLPTHILVRTNSIDTLHFPGTSIGTQEALTTEFAASLGIQAWINYLLAALAMAYAAIASINTLAVAVVSRRRELATQRLAGATRRQVTRMLFTEGAIIATIALGLGTLIALCTVLPTAIAVGSIVPSGPFWVFPAVAFAVFAIVIPVTALTARIAMKRRAIDAISMP